MIHSLDLDVRKTEGILVRVLGLVERRGFSPVTFSADTQGERMSLSLTVRSHRPVELLIRQLEKLFDVDRVALASERALALEAAR